MDTITRDIHRIPFGRLYVAATAAGTPGATRIYLPHYKDSTGLGIYRLMDDHDERKRMLYITAYNGKNQKKYSSEWYTARFLYGYG